MSSGREESRKKWHLKISDFQVCKYWKDPES